jgi:hypothetical protein
VTATDAALSLGMERMSEDSMSGRVIRSDSDIAAGIRRSNARKGASVTKLKVERPKVVCKVSSYRSRWAVILLTEEAPWGSPEIRKEN